MAKFIELHKINDNSPVAINVDGIMFIQPITDDGDGCIVTSTTNSAWAFQESYDKVTRMLIPWVTFDDMMERKESQWIKDNLGKGNNNC